MRNINLLMAGPLVLLALAGCTTASTAPSPTQASDVASPHPATAPHWSYEGEEGPAHWGDLSSAYRQCSAGKQQSPIDLPTAPGADQLDLTIEHGVVGEDTADNGHTVQMTFLDGQEAHVDGIAYRLRQVHFHAESEHTVDGEHRPLEFHFVHETADGSGDLMVVGVFAEEGEHNPAYDAFVRGAIAQHGEALHPKVDIGAMLPTEHEHWTYEGSLTTPPCSEGVRWVVLTTPVELGDDQIERLEDAHDGNHRPVQPLNGRTVS